jgi:hypothetical protein
MGVSDVKADEPAVQGEPGDSVPAPLTAAAKSGSSRKASNGNGNGAHATTRNGNGTKRNGNVAKRSATATKRNANGNGNGSKRSGNGNGAHATNADGASTAVSPVLDRDELTALVETAQRTIDAPPAPARDSSAALELDDRAQRLAGRGQLLDRPPPPRPLPPDRRAKLLAELARSAEELALAEERDRAPARPVPRPRTRTAKRLLAVLALLLPPAAVGVMLKTDVASGELSRADAAFVSGQLVAADQRLRAQLVRVPANGTAVAIARAREAELTTRSLMIEVQAYGGPEAARLRRALRLEREWIAAVGSTLTNPRSALRAELVARGAVAREALEALPGPSGKRLGGVRSLVSYARSRVAATGADTP